MLAAESDTFVVLAILAVRFIVPLFIPRFPLPAILIALVVDAADQSILQQLTDLELTNYQSLDKALDIYYLAIAYVSVYRNWTNPFAVHIAQFLWYYRLVGVLLFEVLDQRWLLVVFPNTFEYFFIAYCIIQTRWDPRRVSNRGMIELTAFIWIVIKLPQEWWIHIAQNDFTDFMKETVFGVDPTSSWSAAFSNRPGVLIAILAAIALLIVAAVKLSRRLPAADWTFGLDMDRSDATVRSTETVVVSLRATVLEKFALIGLIGAIFAAVLDVDTSAARVVGATVLLVLANAALSVWLARRGFEWNSLAIEFVVLAALNAVLLGTYSAIVGDDGVDAATVLFFGLLLTVLIVLFDRFRPADAVARPPTPA